jgi:hypothetical protein
MSKAREFINEAGSKVTSEYFKDAVDHAVEILEQDYEEMENAGSPFTSTDLKAAKLVIAAVKKLKMG